MNVLQIVQAFCYESNLPAPGILAGTSDPNILQELNLFYAVCRKLREAKCWVQMKKTATITTSNGVSNYALPTDFYAPMCDTFWDTTNRWKLAGPQSDARFNELLYGYALVSGRSYFRIFGLPNANEFQVYPTPGTTNLTFTFDYLQKNFILHTATWQETITSDTDTCLFDDDLLITGLKWFWDLSKGLDFSSWQALFQSKIDYAQARWLGSKKTSLYARTPVLAGLDPNIAEGDWSI